MTDKKTIRREMLAARNGMHKNTIEYYSGIICRAITGLEQYKASKKILIYRSTGSEVRTGELLKKVLEDGRTVCFPACIDRTVMEAFVPGESDCWRTGSFGIMEPDPRKCLQVPPEDIDLIICPCSAFDASHTRLGMGGGYYDRYIKRAVNAFTVTAAFELQRYGGKLPAGPFDIKTDLVITEKGIF